MKENSFGLGVFSGMLVTCLLGIALLFGTSEGKQVIEHAVHPAIPYSAAEMLAMQECLAHPEVVHAESTTEAVAGCSLVIHDVRATSAERARAYYVRGGSRVATSENLELTLNDLNAGLALKPTNEWMFHYARGIALFLKSAGDGTYACPDESLAEFTTATELSNGATGSSVAFDGRAHCYIKRKDVVAAVSDLEQAVILDPEHVFDYRLSESNALKEAGMSIKQVALWADYAKRAPADKRVQEAYLVALYDNEEFGKAVDLCSKLLEAGAINRFEVLLWRGRMYQELHEIDKARADFEEVIAMGSKLVAERQREKASTYSEVDFALLSAYQQAKMLLAANDTIPME